MEWSKNRVVQTQTRPQCLLFRKHSKRCEVRVGAQVQLTLKQHSIHQMRFQTRQRMYCLALAARLTSLSMRSTNASRFKQETTRRSSSAIKRLMTRGKSRDLHADIKKQ